MTGHRITDRYFVSPQITPEDVADAKAAGFTTIICNRPDVEVPTELQAAVIEAAAEAAGLAFHVLELTQQTMTPDNIALQKQMIDAAPGPVLAYCASGTRCSVIWALGQAGEMPVADILAATAGAGYDLRGLAPALEAAARR